MKKTSHWLALSTVSVLLASSQVSAIGITKSENAELNAMGRFQALGVIQKVEDPYRRDGRAFLFLKQARLGFNGKLGDTRFYNEWAMGGEEEVKNVNASMSLLDFLADIPVTDELFFRVGQFKVPFGREFLADDGSLLFSDRSISNLATRLGRDVGAAAIWNTSTINMSLGVFTGGGRDNPERYIPENLGIPMLSIRVGYDTTGNSTYNQFKQSGVFDIKETEMSAYFSGIFLEDSLVGHSTALGVKATEKSLLLNENWNPYLKQAPLSKAQLVQTSLEGSIRTPLESSIISAEAELNQALFSNTYGTIRLMTGRIQASSAKKPYEVALRYAFLKPSENFLYKGIQITGQDLIHELTPALVYHHREYSRLMFEVPMYINTPVVVEPGMGSYVLSQQPDQTTYLAPATKGTVSRQFVPEVRLTYQFTF